MAKENCPFEAGDHVWAYCRDSGGEEQQDSVKSQRSAIEEYCRRNNLSLVDVFADEARPGSSTVGRDGLEELRYAARQKPQPVEGIIIWSYSRLARNQLDASLTRGELRKRGYIVHSMTDDIPLGDIAPVIESIIDWKNERFLKDLSRDVQRGLQDLARQGYAPGGFPPRGYSKQTIQIGTKRNGEPHKVTNWVLDPEVAPRVRRAFEMRAKGASYKQIHEATQVLGSFGSYATMFRNRTYLGIRKCGELEIEDAHEPLVDRDLWDAVQATFRPRVRRGKSWPEGKPHPRRASSPFLLSGLAECAHCGAAMVSGSDNVSGNRKTPWRFYLCGRKKREGWSSCPTGKIGAEGPEKAVLRLVSERILKPTFVESLIVTVNDKLSADLPAKMEAQIDQKRKRLAMAEQAIENLLDVAEKFGATSAVQRLAEREAECELLRSEIRQLEMQKRDSRLDIPSKAIREVVDEMRTILGGDSIQARREMLSGLVVSFKMDRTSGKLLYTFPLSKVTGKYKVPPREFESLSPP